MPAQTPDRPGWYPDDSGAMRWFDGSSWTDHVQPGTGGGQQDVTQVAGGDAGPPTAPLAQQGGPPQPGYPQQPPHQPPPQQPGYGGVPPQGPGGYPGAGGPGAAGPGGWQGGPPPGSSGGGKKGLLIALVVAGVLLLVAGIVVAVVLLTGGDDDDDDGGGDSGGDNSSLPDTTPEEVVEQFVDASLEQDCEALEALVTERLLEEEGGCDPEESGPQRDIDYEVGEAEIDEEEETAVVPVELSDPDDPTETDDAEFNLVVEDDEWLIDGFGDEGSGSAEEPTADEPTAETEPTDLPTDIPTDLPTDYSDLTDLPSFPTDIPTDPEELESYLSDYFDELTATP